MAHSSQLEYVGIISKNASRYFENCKVLEVGSLDINGSVRKMFNNCDYIGIDVAEGEGVDIVCQGQDYDGPDNEFDNVISCECMEHNPYWEDTFLNMIRVCRPGGLVLMSCATTGRSEHGTTRASPKASPLTVGLGWDYYKNLTPRNFKGINLPSMFMDYRFWIDWKSYDLYFMGVKKHSDKHLDTDIKLVFDKVDKYICNKNSLKICFYRKVVSSVLGDWWFVLMRYFSERYNIRILKYIHG